MLNSIFATYWQAMQLGMHGFGEVYATSISGGGVVSEIFKFFPRPETIDEEVYAISFLQF